MSGKYKRTGETSGDLVYKVSEMGEGISLKKRQKVEFTHEMAEEILDFEDFAGDRRLRQKHVDYLVQTMRRGTFHPEWVTIITCSLGDKVFRMNGQHTGWARLEMPEDWPCKVELLTYDAKSEHDLRQLYASIDRSSPRTKANVIDSYLAGSHEFDGVKANTLQQVAQGFGVWFWPTSHERGKHDGDDIAYLLQTEQYDLAIKVCAFLDKVSRRENPHVFRAATIAAMFATFHKAPQIAAKFWAPVCDGVGMDARGDPRLKLRNWLMQTAIGQGGGAASAKKKVSQELMFRVCVSAWNAYRDDRSLQNLRASESGRRARVK